MKQIICTKLVYLHGYDYAREYTYDYTCVNMYVPREFGDC